MSPIQLRFTRSFYFRHAFIGGLLAFFCTVIELMMKHAGPLVKFLPVLFMGPWLFLVLREYLAREDDARSFVRCLLDSTVDLRPNPAARELAVRFHTLTSPAHNAVLAHLCSELTETLTIYPGTEMRLLFVPPGPS